MHQFDQFYPASLSKQHNCSAVRRAYLYAGFSVLLFAR
jgi:hypothetical protein